LSEDTIYDFYKEQKEISEEIIKFSNKVLEE
jgi:hypothetical protein